MADKVNSVVVIGLGRFGSVLARDLDARGVKVLGIDRHEGSVQDVADQLPRVVIADSTDEEAMRQLHVADYDLAVVAIGDSLEASVLSVSVLAQVGVRRIWAKGMNIMHRTLLQRMGAERVILPETEAGERVSHMITGSKTEYVRFDDDYAVARTSVPAEMVGRPLGESRLLRRLEIMVIAVRRPGSGYLPAVDKMVPEPDDELVVAGPPAGVDAIGSMD